MRFTKKTNNNTTSTPRIARMTESELAAWGNVILMDLGRTFDNFQYKNGPPSSVTEALNVFTQVWSELESRNS